MGGELCRVDFKIYFEPKIFNRDSISTTETKSAIKQLLGSILFCRDKINPVTSLLWGPGLRDRLFEMVRPVDWNREQPQPANLKCTLFRYQRRALDWMLWRESFTAGSNVESLHAPDVGSLKSQLPEQSILWQPIELPSGHELYFNPEDKELSLQLPNSRAEEQVAGGLLCEEMGLGKTVEIIAVALSNPPLPAAERMKIADGVEIDVLDSSSLKGAFPGGTLIVCPPSLLEQWHEEFERHTGGALTVSLYRGMSGLAAVARESGGKKKTQAQREMELYERMRSGDDRPSYSPAQEAVEAVHHLLAADVVITTFDVLKNEVYFQGQTRSMRHAKKYPVPVCPLLQIRWQRLVTDEAQMVGPFGSVGAMVEQMFADIRWGVTGTPVGRQELGDIRSLLHCLQHPVFSRSSAWRALVSDSILPERSSWKVLQDTLRPLMWRNDKTVVALEHHLPKRSLKVVKLDFKIGEHEFYHDLVENVRTARDTLRSAGPVDVPPPTGTTSKKLKHTKRKCTAEDQSLDSLSELRLCCLHPQLTQQWKKCNQSDLQATTGGTLSMDEILKRLIDKAQGDLQDIERSICSHLNTLAMVVLGVVSSSHEDDDGCDRVVQPQTAAPAKRRKISKKGDAISRHAALQEALGLLEQSFCVFDKGIMGYSRTMETLSDLPEPPPLPQASVVAWKKIQICNNTQLASVYQELGRAEDASRLNDKSQKHMKDLLEQCHCEVSQAMSKFESVQSLILAGQAKFEEQHGSSKQLGFPSTWSQTPSSSKKWLDDLEKAFHDAKRLEQQELDDDEGNTKRMLGTKVQSELGDVERELQSELSKLDHYVTYVKTREASKRLEQDLQSCTDCSVNKVDPQVRVMGQYLKLLSPFRAGTLYFNWQWILPDPKVLMGHEMGAEKEEEEGEETKKKGMTEPDLRKEESFVPAQEWRGKKIGYAFKLGEHGLGYYADARAHQKRVIDGESFKQCRLQLLRALVDQERKLQKVSMPADASVFQVAGLTATEMKLESVRTQIQLVRLLRELHVAEANVRLKSALFHDLDAELAAAASDAPEKVRSKEALKKRIQSHLHDAYALVGRVSFLKTKLAETTATQEAALEEVTAAAVIEVDDGSLEQAEALAVPQAPGCRPESAHGIECPICLNTIIDDIYLFTGCGHAFCKLCSSKLIESGGICAVCRCRVTLKHVQRVAVAVNKSNALPVAATDPEAEEKYADIKVAGDWSSKFEALIRRILFLKKSVPDEKCLVFSQWPEALKLMSLGLKANGVQHTLLLGGGKRAEEAVKEFHKEDICVFLLAQKAGGQGLTLVRANHVFLLEPALDPAVEQQAIARVHRIGQTRPVTVTRLLLRGSIEEAVLAVQESKQRLFDDDGEAGDLAAVDGQVGYECIGREELEGLLEAVVLQHEQLDDCEQACVEVCDDQASLVIT